VRRFVADQRDSTFSYAEVGASKSRLPPGYKHERYRVRLGSGKETFARACAALDGWTMFQLGWVRLYDPRTPVGQGATVALLIRHFGLWSLNASRIVYVFDEEGPVRAHGFGYGTLMEHAEEGEEKFAIEWHRADDSVWYSVVAFSRPRNVLARVGYPVTRFLQKRFARDSQRAMVEAVNGSSRGK